MTMTISVKATRWRYGKTNSARNGDQGNAQANGLARETTIGRKTLRERSSRSMGPRNAFRRSNSVARDLAAQARHARCPRLAATISGQKIKGKMSGLHARNSTV
ncbi:MAG: hypothetical protein LBH10_05620 [Burkholderiaceae bacterium]|nr:hypothetical protein [Burkholderiaceae bacterium]